MPSAARPNGCDAASTSRLGMTRAFTPPRKSPTPQLRLAASASNAAKLVRHRPRGGDGVELVRVVEDGRLGCAGGTGVVVARHSVQQLGGSLELLEHPQSEVDVAEQAALLRRREDGRPTELARAADVVDESRGDQQVCAQPRMDLAELAAERRHADRVLEQAAR